MRESIIERYLHEQVELAGGTTRKFTGRINDPDRIVIWPRVAFAMPPTKRIVADIHMIELKATGERPRAGQVREHKRLRALGVEVHTLDSKEAVRLYVRANQWGLA